MELLLSCASSICGPIMQSITAAGAKALSRPLRCHVDAIENAWTQEELDAKIDKFLGNGFAQQLLDIKMFVQEALQNVQNNIKYDVLEQAVHSEIRALQQRIIETGFRFDPWLDDQMNVNKQRHFISAYERNQPGTAIQWLHLRLTTATVGRKLTEDIVMNCGKDWRKFLLWEQNICLILCQACTMEIAYLWLTSPGMTHGMDDNLNAICEPTSSRPVIMKKSGDSDVSKQIDVLKTCVTEMLAELEDGRLRVKSSFLFTKCGDKQHKKCGASKDDLCNELAAKVYKLSNVPNYRKSLATEIQTELSTDYPQFEWSVACRPIGLDATYYKGPSAPATMWNQSLTEMDKKRRRARLGRIRSSSLKYGELSCYTVAAHCAVFWTEAKNFREGTAYLASEAHSALVIFMLKDQDSKLSMSTSDMEKLKLVHYRDCSVDTEEVCIAELNGATYPLMMVLGNEDKVRALYWPGEGTSLSS